MFMTDATDGNPKLFDVVIKQLGSQISRGDHLITQLPKTLRAVCGENEWGAQMWRQRIDKDTGQVYTFERFEDFVKTKPTAGIGASMKMLRDICREDPVALDLMDQAVQRPHGGTRVKMLNQQLEPETGTEQGGSDRHLRRLRRDRADLHERVLSGEMTASEAAVQAGFYPKRVSIRLDSAASAVATINKSASPEFIDEMIQLLLEGRR